MNEKTTWKTVRAAVGIVQGVPADAVEDTVALYGETCPYPPGQCRCAPPAGFVSTELADDLFPVQLLRFRPGVF